MYTYNCQTLRNNDKLIELISATKNIEWDIIGLCEVRRDKEYLMKLDGDMEIYFNGAGAVGGTGFLVNRRSLKNITCYKSYSHRISKMIWKLNAECGGGRIQIIQVYAPTSTAEDTEIEDFYSLLQTAIEEDRCKYSIIIGDFNAKVGSVTDFEALGKYGYGSRNTRGEQMLEFMDGNGLYVMNSFFKKPESKKWTWMSPDGETRNEIDFIITSKKGIITDVSVNEMLDIGSDHRAVEAKIMINTKEKRRRRNINIIPKKLEECDAHEYEEVLQTELIALKSEYQENIEMCADEMRRAIKTTTEKVMAQRPQSKDKFKIPKEIRRLMEKRRRMKKSGKNKAERSEISKLIRIKMKEWSNSKKVKELEETVENGGSIKKYWKSQSIGRDKIIQMKDKDGIVKKDKTEIIDIIATFYRELYKNGTEGNDSFTRGKRFETEKESKSYSCTEEQVLEITKNEIEWAIKKLKKGKATGKDGISNEELKAGGETLIEALKQLFDLSLKYKIVPESWKEAQLILLFKNGDKANIENYRPLSLLSVVYKLFMNIIYRRIEKELDENMSITQSGFRKNMSTLDNIFVIKQLIRRSHEYKMPLVLTFIDFKKAFDSIFTADIIQTLEESSIHPAYTEILQRIYEGASLEIMLDQEKRKVLVRRGLRQGDVMSGKIFIKTIDRAYKELDWERKGIKINGKFVNILKFADDLVVVSKSIEEAEEMMVELTEVMAKIGLEMNVKKTKVMTLNIEGPEEGITVKNTLIEKVCQYIYLGQMIHINEKGNEKEVSRRIALGWKAFNRYRHLFRSNVKMQAKKRLWNMCVLPVMIYGVETWILSERVTKKMRVAQRAMERSMLAITRKDRKSNVWIRSQTEMEDIGKIMVRRKWNWAGHIVRTKDERITKTMIDWYPRDRKRSRGRPNLSWDEEMKKICGGVTWQRVAHQRSEWNRMREVYNNVWLHKN